MISRNNCSLPLCESTTYSSLLGTGVELERPVRAVRAYPCCRNTKLSRNSRITRAASLGGGQNRVWYGKGESKDVDIEGN